MDPRSESLIGGLHVSLDGWNAFRWNWAEKGLPGRHQYRRREKAAPATYPGRGASRWSSAMTSFSSMRRRASPGPTYCPSGWNPNDPSVFGVVGAVLALTGLGASLIPALRYRSPMFIYMADSGMPWLGLLSPQYLNWIQPGRPHGGNQAGSCRHQDQDH